MQLEKNAIPQKTFWMEILGEKNQQLPKIIFTPFCQWRIFLTFDFPMESVPIYPVR
jgi:hypothetical protein